MSTYVVLHRDPVSGYWTEVETVDARSSEDAVRRVATREGANRDGLWVAVPARSWKPMAVAIEVKSTVKVNAA